MTWYRDPKLLTAGIAVLSIAACQTLQIILYIVLSTATIQLQGLTPGIVSILALFPAVLSTVFGGAFLGRLRSEVNWFLWCATAVATGFLPIAIQLLMRPEIAQLLNPSIWIMTIGNMVLWVAGCWIGSISVNRWQNREFDLGLLRWTAGVVVLVLAMMAFTYGSVVFSQGYRMARNVNLTIPADVEEQDVPNLELGVAQMRRFEKTVEPSDESIQNYYLQTLKEERWIDVSRIFQDWPPGKWEQRSESYNGETVEYQLAGAHWQDTSGKVLVTLVLQAVKEDPTLEWDRTPWQIHGVILSRGYSEPVKPATSTEEDPSAEASNSQEPTEEDSL